MANGKMGGMRVGVLAIGCWLMVLGYFGWWGMTNPVWEGDSLAYHIPIAEMVERGKWADINSFKLPFYFYPAMGETLLAGWTGLGLPGNWFNLLGWGMLTVVVYGLGRRLGLGKENSVMAAAAVAFWPSVVRLIPTQTVDIWVAVWWGAAMLQLTIDNLQFTIEKQKNILRRAGIFLGLLVGTKYSGLLFAIILVVFFYNKLKKHFWDWLIPAILIGGFWYARNWLLTGNPVYPLEISRLGWKGLPTLGYFGGNPGTTLITRPMLVIEALVSEYLVWAGLLLLPVVRRSRLVWLGMANFGVYLLIPSLPQNIISDLRYLYPAMIPLLLEGGVWMVENRKKNVFRLLVGMSILAVMTQLDYHPKLFVVLLLIICGIYFLVNNTPSNPPLNLRGGRGSS